MKDYIRRAKKPFALELIFHLIYITAIASLPYIIKQIVDCNYSNGVSDVIRWACVFAGAAAAGMAAQYVSQRCAWWVDKELFTMLRGDLFHAILSKEPDEFRSRDLGEYSSWINNDVAACSDYTTYLSLIIEGFISLIAYAVFVFLLDWHIALVLYITSFLLLFLPKVTGRKFSEKKKLLLKKTGEYTEEVLDLLGGYPMVSSDTAAQMDDRHRKSLNETENARYDFGKFKTLTNVFNGSVMYLSNAVAVAALAYFLFRGQITAGVAAATIAYVQEFMSPVRDIIDSISSLKSVAGVTDNVIQEIENAHVHTRMSVPFERQISAEDVSYAFEHFSVEHFSYIFEKGKKYAIVGGSGTGKSTVLNLLTGNLKAQAGKITVDGTEVTYNICSDTMFYVNQQSHIFAEPFTENVTVFGSFANDFDWKSFLPEQKYETIMRTRDCSTLSGGEKQLVSLCRAILSGRKILLLDEPFSALDSTTEAVVCKKLMQMQDRTVVMITHNEQPEYLKLFDQVIVM